MSFDPTSPTVFTQGSFTFTQVTHFEFSVEQQMTDRKINELLDEGLTWICANQLDAAMQAFQEACRLETRNIHLAGKVRANLGVVLTKLGMTKEAETCYLEIERQEVSGDLKALSLSNRALILLEEGKLREAFLLLQEALKCAPQNAALLARIANNNGIIFQRQKNFADARRCFLNGLGYVKETDDKRTMIRLLNNLAAISIALDDFDAARGYLNDIAGCLKEGVDTPYQLAQLIAQNRLLLNHKLRSIT